MQSNDGNWRIIADFDLSSRFDRCSVSGLTKRSGDIGVFRPLLGLVDQEGYFDLSQYAIEQAAALLGWASPADVQDLKDRLKDLETKLGTARKTAYKAAQDAVRMAGIRAQKEDV